MSSFCNSEFKSPLVERSWHIVQPLLVVHTHSLSLVIHCVSKQLVSWHYKNGGSAIKTNHLPLYEIKLILTVRRLFPGTISFSMVWLVYGHPPLSLINDTVVVAFIGKMLCSVHVHCASLSVVGASAKSRVVFPLHPQPYSTVLHSCPRHVSKLKQ